MGLGFEFRFRIFGHVTKFSASQFNQLLLCSDGTMASISRLLQPAILEADPSEERSVKIYKHWIRTFESFLSVAQSALLQSTHEDDDEGDDPTLDKLALLYNHIPPDVYSYVEDCNSYDAARKELDQVYLRKDLNDIYARHHLLTRKQKPAKDVAQFSHAIKEFSKDCVCNALTAEEFRAELACDAFITGLDSSTICQRLLEEDTLSFQSAVTKALILELAHERTSFHLADAQSSIAAGHSTNKACYFCGGKIHSGLQCPAKDACCFNCSKRGHFQKVCLVKPVPRPRGGLVGLAPPNKALILPKLKHETL